MKNKDITHLLKEYQDHPRLGGLSDEQVEKGRRDLLQKMNPGKELIEEDFRRSTYSYKDYVDYYWWNVSRLLLRPAMVGLGIFVIVIGGGFTTVSASTDAVPGEVLYTVKLASEKAQLSFAASDRKRAELHLAFATRRLNELSTITKSNVGNKAELVKVATDGFKTQVSDASNVMLGIEDDVAVELAKLLDSQLDAYTSSIQSVATDLGDDAEVEADVVAAQDNVDEVEDAAVEVLVTHAENQEDDQSNEDVESVFQNDVSQLDQALKLTLGRISVIQSVLATTEGITVDEGVDVNALEAQLHDAQAALYDAMNTMAAGGYRTAFEMIKEIEGNVDEVTVQVIALEISIAEQRTLLQSEEVEETIERE